MPSGVLAEDKSTPRLRNITERDRISDAKHSCSILRKGITHAGTKLLSLFLIRNRSSDENWLRSFYVSAYILTRFAIYLLSIK